MKYSHTFEAKLFGSLRRASAYLLLVAGLLLGGFVTTQFFRDAVAQSTTDVLINPLGGNVGIGTTNPGVRLHVVGEDALGNDGVKITTNSVSAGVRIENTRDGGAEYYINATANGSANGAGKLAFGRIGEAIADMVLTPEGKVGIGTTAPSTLLEILARPPQGGLQTNVLQLRSNSGATNTATKMSFVNSTDPALSNRVELMAQRLGDDESSFSILAPGNVGIGTTAPTASLEVLARPPQGALKNRVLQLRSNNGATNTATILSFVNSTDPALNNRVELVAQRRGLTESSFSILVPGNVGIGAEDPSEKLDVDGTVKATAFVGDGSGLTNLPSGSDSHSLDAADGSPVDAVFVDNEGDVGIGTTSPHADLEVLGKNGVVFTAEDTTGTIPMEGPGSRLMWYPGKSAFRVGQVSGSGIQWNDGNIGLRSVAMGDNTIASGVNSTALGEGWATGNTSTALGNGRAEGSSSVALGGGTASGDNSTTTGRSTEASGFASTAMGDTTKAIGRYSTAMGFFTTVQAYASVAIGRFNKGDGDPLQWVDTDPLFEIGNGSNGTLSNAMTVLKNGNVGIGTESPNSPLEVVGGAARGETKLLQLRSDNDTDGTATTLRFVNSTNPSFNNHVELVAERTSSDQSSFIIRTFDNGEEDSVIVAPNGDVGIGTTPTAKLQVAGGAQQDGGIRVTTSANDAGLQLNNTGSGGENYFIYTTRTGSSNGSGKLAFGQVGQVADMVLTSGGNVGVGTTTAPAKLTVGGEPGADAMQVLANGNMAFRVMPDGEVCIGTGC